MFAVFVMDKKSAHLVVGPENRAGTVNYTFNRQVFQGKYYLMDDCSGGFIGAGFGYIF